jgi:hypothetical protein
VEAVVLLLNVAREYKLDRHFNCKCIDLVDTMMPQHMPVMYGAFVESDNDDASNVGAAF